MKFPSPRIQTLNRQVLLGEYLEMSVVQNRTRELWTSFGPKIKNIENRKGEERFSLQIYPKDYFQHFDPMKVFTKWAAVPVVEEKEQNGLRLLILEKGLYAVFDYRGMPGDSSIFQYIYQEWLPKLGFTLADRPHFEVLGPNYQNGSSESEEEIWIPIEMQKV
ncbi:GyrI-like domain-containing protein [Algoriphagus namhaensis]|uniref:GyrI-like domain-containing protein n=1 Tax=Algoriphagus namhaensis TaxID=915353 RepID=A0ABV8AU11_9BACT